MKQLEISIKVSASPFSFFIKRYTRVIWSTYFTISETAWTVTRKHCSYTIALPSLENVAIQFVSSNGSIRKTLRSIVCRKKCQTVSHFRECIMSDVTLKIVDLVGTPFCIALEDGDKVRQAIAEQLRLGNQIILDLADIELLTSSFLNAAVGDLYEEFTEEEIRDHLHLENATKDDRSLIQYVVANAKLFYARKRQGDAA